MNEFGDERIIVRRENVELRVPDHDPVDYIRVVRIFDEEEEELVYWDSTEWRTEDEAMGTMSAIMGAVQKVLGGEFR
jgi:hypothetical protein